VKYEEDIAEFSGQISLKLQADNDLLRESLKNECDSKLSSLEAKLAKDCSSEKSLIQRKDLIDLQN